MSGKADFNDMRKILDYWFTIEFLTQDKAQKGFVSSKTDKKNYIWDSILLNDRDMSRSSIEGIITDEAKRYKKPVWGTLTIYIGKVPREKCIEYINRYLPYDSDKNKFPEEKITDDIFCASLQLSRKGMYVKKSLSLSPILWAVTQINRSTKNFSDMVDEKSYQEDMDKLEAAFFNLESTVDDTNEEGNSGFPSEEESRAFSENSVTSKGLQNILDHINENFIKGYLRSNGQESCLKKEYQINFQLFKDEKTRENDEDIVYSGLSRGYFLGDLKILLEMSKRGTIDSSSMGEDLGKYILALCRKPERKRMDLLISPEAKYYYGYLNWFIDILDVDNAPLGKWPSRFMPAFMQQIAINLTAGKANGDYGHIFSVNGPPGTGKTTMIKEIVAGNVVERAALLSKYDNPDDAFVPHKLNGKAPDEYNNKWYSLKNDKINDYSILVASSNNAAVENISKELPIWKRGDLSPLDDDSRDMRDSLEKVRNLFDPDESGSAETAHIYGGNTVSYKDIYFTKYVTDLLHDRKDGDAEDNDNFMESEDDVIWGLISAALGKPSNLRKFYKNVLSPYGFDHSSNDAIKESLEKYKIAKQEFLDQLSTVKQLQGQLHVLSVSLKEKIHSKEKAEQTKLWAAAQAEAHKQAIEKAQNEIQELEKTQHKYQSADQKYQDECNGIQNVIDSLQNSIASLNQEISMHREDMAEQKRSIHWWVRLFNRSKYDAAQKKTEKIRSEIEKIEDTLKGLNQTVVDKEAEKRECIGKINSTRKKLNEAAENVKRLDAQIRSHRDQQNKESDDCKSAEKEYSRACEKYAIEVGKVNQDQYDRCTILDEEFFDRMFSDNENESAKAQVSNPWFTERYNREREKLFAHAMRLNKEFILSSKSCRKNFNMLSFYWGYRKTRQQERVYFPEDKDDMLPDLIQTLFLLVPVISTTFSSAGIMLRDVKKTGTIGLLVVDEAGQAQPQMALGSLYRCRKAVIIGDPKQIEPVVTEDLDLLKNAVTDEMLAPYTSDDLSVQNFADRLNSYGTYLDRDTDHPEWVGCPLLIHRRCISPMFDISNRLSYDGIMKQMTAKPIKEVESRFIYPESRWIDVTGNERGNGNHFVDKQGEKACELLDIAFKKQQAPKIFIISPFKTVVNEMIKYIRSDQGLTKENKDYLLKGIGRIGTVHTFQGRETEEVIFLLGCDQDSLGAVRWVNTNIVNVAATRAKYRLYIIGDKNVWRNSNCVNEARLIMEKYYSDCVDDVIKRITY